MENQIGRSMIEMLGVLAIIGVLSIGGLAGYDQAMIKYRTNKMHVDIQAISSEVVSLYAWQRGYPSCPTAASCQARLCENDIFPDGCDGTDGNPENPFDGVYTVTTDTNNQTLTVTADNIPDAACTDLINKEWPYVNGTPTCTGTGNKTFSITFD